MLNALSHAHTDVFDACSSTRLIRSHQPLVISIKWERGDLTPMLSVGVPEPPHTNPALGCESVHHMLTKPYCGWRWLVLAVLSLPSAIQGTQELFWVSPYRNTKPGTLAPSVTPPLLRIKAHVRLSEHHGMSLLHCFQLSQIKHTT